MSEGIKLIEAERRRQIEKEGFDTNHDRGHEGGELAMAAVCYAAPEPVYKKSNTCWGFHFVDPWPDWWDEVWDKRRRRRNENLSLIPGHKLPKKQRIRDLVKAGALIAAEIDRLLSPPVPDPEEE